MCVCFSLIATFNSLYRKGRGNRVHATVNKNSEIKTYKVTWVLQAKSMSLF